VSVARLDALYNWTAAAAEAKIQKGIPPVSASVLRTWGVFYSTLLGAIYLPAYLRLRAEAEVLADEQSETERRSWLEQHGLALSVDVLRRFAAIIAPILAGEANKVFHLL
jgi:hypothetical protein